MIKMLTIHPVIAVGLAFVLFFAGVILGQAALFVPLT